MLNITDNKISQYINIEDFKACRQLVKTRIRRLTLIIFASLLLGLIIFSFLPWTQSIDAKGYVTTRSPEHRPQAIHSMIAGRIVKWYVKEGDFVNKGDTILFLSEVKNDYLDPELLERTSEQLNAKEQSISSYDQKIKALQKQYKALQESLVLKTKQIHNKIEQAHNKVKNDSIDLTAYKANLKIAENQLSRTQELYNKGLKSLTEVQEKELKVQSATAKLNVQQNKYYNQLNSLSNLQIDLLSIQKEYADKLAKSQSDKQSAIASKMESIAATSKLRNQLSNYTIRQDNHYTTAPQAGYINEVLTKGIGETIKEGTDIATIAPMEYDLAVQVSVKPQDLPLLRLGSKATIRFDGWPVMVISGWPESSVGVFRGTVVAIDQSINSSGYYRIMISPDENDRDWPAKLRVGTGARTFLLLNEVPIWYEIWRQLNGFPDDHYSKGKDTKNEIKRKAPIKSVK
ncbi:HlyD family secretion protein [Labilibacter marinus]|uniref:HlyD family secretion protein n=1 Tax=Labilibacter marinus TaxID=1477105 RepID=UPI00083252FA|nr:HlyD family efflux transporter periplasmic adaptor subunit [Labilibacter marinus]